MRCMECGSFQVSVRDSRASGSTRITAGKVRNLTPQCVEARWGEAFIWRRRKCGECNYMWSTVEVAITETGEQV